MALLQLEKKLSRVYGRSVKILGPYLWKKTGRKVVDVRVGAKTTTYLLGRVRLEIKLGRKLMPTETVDHIDEDPTNDAYDNLQVLTRADNARKSADSSKLNAWNRSSKGRLHASKISRGQRNPNAKVADKEVKKYRKLFSDGKVEITDIADQLGCSRRCVRSFLFGRAYIHVGGPISKPTRAWSGRR